MKAIWLAACLALAATFLPATAAADVGPVTVAVPSDLVPAAVEVIAGGDGAFLLRDGRSLDADGFQDLGLDFTTASMGYSSRRSDGKYLYVDVSDLEAQDVVLVDFRTRAVRRVPAPVGLSSRGVEYEGWVRFRPETLDAEFVSWDGEVLLELDQAESVVGADHGYVLVHSGGDLVVHQLATGRTWTYPGVPRDADISTSALGLVYGVGCRASWGDDSFSCAMPSLNTTALIAGVDATMVGTYVPGRSPDWSQARVGAGDTWREVEFPVGTEVRACFESGFLYCHTARDGVGEITRIHADGSVSRSVAQPSEPARITQAQLSPQWVYATDDRWTSDAHAWRRSLTNGLGPALALKSDMPVGVSADRSIRGFEGFNRWFDGETPGVEAGRHGSSLSGPCALRWAASMSCADGSQTRSGFHMIFAEFGVYLPQGGNGSIYDRATMTLLWRAPSEVYDIRGPLVAHSGPWGTVRLMDLRSGASREILGASEDLGNVRLGDGFVAVDREGRIEVRSLDGGGEWILDGRLLDVDGTRVAWADAEGLKLTTFGKGVSEPFLLGTLQSTSDRWRAEFDFTSPVAAGTLTVRDSRGAVVAQIPTPAGPNGSVRGVSWDQKAPGLKDETYTWTLSVKDAAGRSATTSLGKAITGTITVGTGIRPTPSPTKPPTPSPKPSVATASPTKRPVAPSGQPSATSTSRPVQRTAPYEVPGTHLINGRQWNTVCGPYSRTVRCRTDIWATQVVKTSRGYERRTGWVFNNLTYLPSPRALWKSNPLGNTGQWTTDGRRWRTECDTSATGRNACRSYIWTDVISATPKAAGGYTYATKAQWVFNNIVRFS